MFSGGVGSWAAARRVASTFASEGDEIVLLFADTMMEDEDLYRFLDHAEADVATNSPCPVHLVKLREGRDPWQVFFDERFLGNTRIDPCSKILKRKFLRRYIEDEFDPAGTTIYLGIDWTEEHRFDKARHFWEPWDVRAPMCERPFVEKETMLADLKRAGIRPPRLYAMGFPHNNCGGFCIKAGQAHFKLLLEQMPERYAYHERREQELREYLGKDVAILRDRRGGTTKPMTLRTFRERLIEGGKVDPDDWGGCGCFSG